MTERCRRCDFSGDEIISHAIDAQHPRCICCYSSLGHEETQTCQRCIGRIRADIADIVRMYGQLAEVAEALKPSWSPSEGRSGGDGHPIPGGDAMVLLGPGGAGSDNSTRGGNREHAADEWPSDSPSVLAVLTVHEDDWRHTFGHPAAGLATVEGAAAYLSGNLTRAAEHHPGFDEFADEITSLRSKLAAVTAEIDRPVPAAADCFTCGGRLGRQFHEAKACGHERPSWSLTRLGYHQSYDETVSERDDRVARWEIAHSHCVQGGVALDYTCSRCHRTYTPAEYALAFRAEVEDEDALVTAAQFHALYGVRPATVRKWVERGRVEPKDTSEVAHRYRLGDLVDLHKTMRGAA